MKKEILTNIDLIKENDTVLVLDVPLFLDDEICLNLQKSKAKIVSFSPIDYKSEKLDFCEYIKYEVGSEEAISALLLNYFVKNATDEVKDFIEELDIGYLSAESNIGEEEFETLANVIKGSNSSYLLIGDNFFTHNCFKNIVKILDTLNSFSPFHIIINEKFIDKIEQIIDKNEKLDEVEELASYNGTIIYISNKIENDILIGGEMFSKVAKIEDGDKIEIFIDRQSFKKVFKLDTNLKGNIALCSNYETNENLYNYKQAIIKKV